MTSGLAGAEDPSSLDAGLAGRRFDIAAAGRHSLKVKAARRAIVFGVPIFLVGLVLLVVVQPFHFPFSLQLGKVHIEGTKISVIAPRLSGYRGDGTPYSVKASLGTQDLAAPNVIDMQDVEAEIGMTDKTTSHVTASTGVYDSSIDGLKLTGAVHMRNSSGYDVRTSNAAVDFKTGDLVADAGVRVTLTGADISADAMSAVDDGHKISFSGNVHSTFRSDPTPTVAQSSQP